MIRLSKAQLPQELQELLADRTSRFLDLLAAGQPIPDGIADSYRDRRIKLLLRTETADKCAYCESKVPHIDHGDVEHIVPKAVRPELRFSFDNLTYACSVCNGKKGAFHNEQTPLLNPYVDDPQDHLVAVGPMVMRRPTSDRGLVTQRVLDLNRGALVERRAERLEAVGSLMDQIARTSNVAIRQVLLDQVNQESLQDKEYAFVVRGYVSAMLDSLGLSGERPLLPPASHVE